MNTCRPAPLFEVRDAFGRRHDRQQAHVARAQPAQAVDGHARPSRRWPAWGRAGRRSASPRSFGAPSRSSAGRPRSPRCAPGRSSRPALCGTSSRNASSMPEAGPQHGHRHDAGRDAADDGALQGRLDLARRGAPGRAVASAASSTLTRRASRRNSVAGWSRSRRRASASSTDRVPDDGGGAWRAREDSTPGWPRPLRYDSRVMRLTSDEIEYISRKIVKTLVGRRQRIEVGLRAPGWWRASGG